jgi:cell division FtsZ-interacting protein ZapD
LSSFGNTSGYDAATHPSVVSSRRCAVILYEYPFNERIRTYLRLQHLFFRLGELVGRSSATDHHYAITTLFEIVEVGVRADLKTDVLKDLEKQKHRARRPTGAIRRSQKRRSSR